MKRHFRIGGVPLGVLFLLGVTYAFLPVPDLETEGDLEVEQKITIDAPIQLRFNQWMNKKSVEKALSIAPKREGGLVWKGRKVLEFLPLEPWAIGEEFRVKVMNTAQSFYGKPLKENQSFKVVVTGPPFVKWVDPREGVIQTDQILTVMFDRPMVQDSATPFLNIDPPVKGKKEWITPAILQFVPEAWPKASTLHFAIPRGVPASSGGATEEAFTWELKTPSPRVVQSTPPPQQNLELRGAIQLEFNQIIDLQELRPGDNVLLYPSNDLDADQNPRQDGFFNGEITHGKDPKTLVFTPTFPYQPDQDYRLLLKAGLKGEGPLPMAEEAELLFHTQKETGAGSWELGAGSQESGVKRSQLPAPSSQLILAELCPLSQETFFKVSERFGWQDYRCGDAEKIDYIPQQHPQDPLGFNVQEILKKDIPGGYYFLALQNGNHRIAQAFFKGDSLLLLKKSAKGVLVWALDKKGHPLSKMQVSLLDRAGKRLAEGVTNEEGIYFLAKEFEEGLYVIGKKGQSRAMASDLWSPQRSSSEGVSEPQNYHFVTDKNRYKPGETLYWNGLYRLEEDARLRLPERAKAEVKIEDSARETQATLRPLFGRYGSFYGEWKIPDTFAPGRYFLVVQLTQDEEEHSFEKNILIEDPGWPDLTVQAQNARSHYSLSERMTLDFESTSSSGFIAAGLKGKWILVEKATSQKLAEESFIWDERGKIRLTLEPDTLSLRPGVSYSLWITAEYFDGRTAGTQVDFEIHQGLYDLSLSANRYWAKAGEEIVLTVNAIDPQGHLLRDKKINLSLGNDKMTVETEERPKSILFKLPDTPGFYSLRAESKDEEGHLLQIQLPLVVTAPGFSSPSDKLELKLDQSDYLVGGKASLLLLAPQALELPKKVLLTVERGTLLSHQLIDLEKPNQEVDLFIQENMMPNVFVNATVFDEKQERFLSDTVVLKISPREKEIKIDLLPQIDQDENQKKVILQIRSHDYQERPLPAQLTLQLSTGPLPLADPQETFYAPRPRGVQSFYGLERRPGAEEDNVAKEKAWQLYSGPRGKTLYFNPRIKTDAAGTATLELNLPPDFIKGELRAIAVAQADQFGAAKVPLEIKRTPFLRPHLPSSVFRGDRFMIETELVNPQDQDFETRIELIAPDLKISGPPQKKVFLKKQETALVKWEVEVLESSKSSLQVAFRTPETFASQELVVNQAPFADENPDFLESKIKLTFDPWTMLEKKAGLPNDPDLLTAFKTTEGGYSLWINSEISDPFFSAYALFLFKETPPQKLVDYLWKTLESDETLNLEQRIFILGALSEAGEYDTKATVALFQKRAEAPLAAQGLLLLNLDRLREAGQKSVTPLIERLKSEIVSHAVQEDQKAYFEEEKASYFKSSREVTEVLTFALKEASPDNPLLDPLINYLKSSPQEKVETESGDLVLKRTYPSFFKQGDMVRARLEIVVPQEMDHVLLQEHLPAGLQARALNVRLADALAQDREEEKAYREGYTVIPNPVWHFDHHELKPDRLILFAAHLPPGVYTIDFLAEAVFQGDFRHPPALLYSLFDQKARAFTLEERIKIQ